jgi:hypothetical protein
MIRIDLEKARTLIREAMQTQGPDFMYNADGDGYCWNVPDLTVADGDPRKITGCIVGTALTMLGIDLNTDEARRGGSIYELMRLLEDAEEAVATPGALRYMAYVQSAQDAGDTWGGAIAKAEERLPLLRQGEERGYF